LCSMCLSENRGASIRLARIRVATCRYRTPWVELPPEG
jgi:hypothetical protein